MSHEEADRHLEAAVGLAGITYVKGWLARREAKRGRPAGVASDERRCQWACGQNQCKNGRRADSDYCGIHASKSHLAATH